MIEEESVHKKITQKRFLNNRGDELEEN